MPLEGGDVRSLETLGASGDLEFNRLTFVQRFISLRLNRGEMDENVLARLALDESKSLAGIKPLHCSLFFQLCFSFLFELFGAVFHRLQAKKEGCKCGLAAPSTILKVLQEQQTQCDRLTFSLPSPFNSAPRVSRSSEAGDLQQFCPIKAFLSKVPAMKTRTTIISTSPGKRANQKQTHYLADPP